jgi:membrane-bound lytic murein transglycosylase MltF
MELTLEEAVKGVKKTITFTAPAPCETCDGKGSKNPNDVEASKSSDGKSWGLMQVTLKTAQWLDPKATVAKLNNPEYSIDLAAKYLKFLFDYFPQVDSRRIEWVVKSYNQGQGNSANERAGKSQGFAHAYWAKYLKLTSEV